MVRKATQNQSKERFPKDSTDAEGLTCPKCNKRFSQKSHLKRHFATHLGQFKFWCEECKKGYQDKANYTRHMTIHEGRTFPCQLCPKRFSDEYKLKYHQAEHTGIYPYTCSTCQTGFKDKQKWMEHENQHAGIQFSCRNCSKMFNLESKRDRHEKSCGK